MSWGTDWGSGPWGSSGSDVSVFYVALAEAVRENVIRVTFSLPVYFSRWHDPLDGSVPARYSVQADPTTIGIDDKPARVVAVADVQAVPGDGTQIDVWLDRRMSPAGAHYRVAVADVVSIGSLYTLDPARSSWVVDGVAQGLPLTDVAHVLGNRDVANPQVGAGSGRYQYDDTGDYGIDQGLAAYKKRVFRRLITRRGAFRHMPDYGVGFPDHVKQLARSSIVTTLQGEAIAQIRQEPETLDVSVTIEQSAADPGLWVYRVQARTTIGNLTDFLIPVPN